MSVELFNQREKIAAPPFVTVSIKDDRTKRDIYKIRSKLDKCEMGEKTRIFSSEAGLLKAFVVRKGTQLRLEKALMLTRRILTLVLRWKSNACWNDFCKFKDAFEMDSAKVEPKEKVGKRQAKKTDRVKGSIQEIRLPSRQWANWVTYLTLRDLLLLSKIKYECERTVGYWLGMISCSHHPSDSLIIVGILSRIWAVSSGMVEEYANQVYPSLCFISSLLSPTKADNWLEDIDFPNDLFTWLEKILGFPFKPAAIGGSEHIFRAGRGDGGSKSERRSGTSNMSSKNRMDKVLAGASRSSFQDRESVPDSSSPTMSYKDTKQDEMEDLGEPVNITVQQQQPSSISKKRRKRKPKKKQQVLDVQTSKKVCLDERWTKFFKNFKSKLGTEGGRKQLLGRTKKYKSTESNPEIILKLAKVRKFLRQDKRDDLLIFIPKFKRFLSRTLSNTNA